MNISSIDLAGFMSHDRTSVQLPSRGLVLVTGANGSGKSALVEAVAVACWGKTLRGTRPWSGKGHAEVRADGLVVRRTATKAGKQSLKWHEDGAEPTRYESPTKAQGALEHVLGTLDAWRRTCVFSSQDAAHFTTATDAVRKRLIEQLLGLDRFDPALLACRADRKGAEADLRVREAELAQLESQKEGAEARLADARGVLGKFGRDPVDDGAAAKRDRLGKLLAATRRDISGATTSLRQAGQAGTEHAVVAREARRRLAALEKGECGECGQEVPPEVLDALRSESERSEGLSREARARGEEQEAGAQAELQELQEEAEDLRGRMAELDGRVRAASMVREQRAAAEHSVRTAGEALEGIDQKIDDARAASVTVRCDLAELRAAEAVLGTRGFRAHLLGTALGGLEASANSWLSRICGTPPIVLAGDAAEVEARLGGGLCLSLKPYTELGKGGTSDAISMEVFGAGGGHGYRAASGGQRRRIDVALLLALADVASAAHGREEGSVFVDEALDTLDEDGAAAVAGVLRELAEDRCVVVISHSTGLQRTLRPDRWFEVLEGHVVQIL